MVAKHSVQTLISVTRLRRGRFVLQHALPSASTSHASGSSSHISTYEPLMIFFMSLGGIAANPGILEIVSCDSTMAGENIPVEGGS